MEPAGWWSALLPSRIAQLHMPQWERSCPGSHHPSLYYILRAVNTGLWPPVSHSQVAHTGRIQISLENSKLCVRSVCPHLFLAGCCLDKPVPTHLLCHGENYNHREERKWRHKDTEHISWYEKGVRCLRIYKWINCFQSTFLKENGKRFTGIFGYWILDLWINKTNNLECITLGNYNHFSIFLTFCKLNYLLRCSCWQSNLSSCISRNENNLTGNSKKKEKKKKNPFPVFIPGKW